MLDQPRSSFSGDFRKGYQNKRTVKNRIAYRLVLLGNSKRRENHRGMDAGVAAALEVVEGVGTCRLTVVSVGWRSGGIDWLGARPSSWSFFFFEGETQFLIWARVTSVGLWAVGHYVCGVGNGSYPDWLRSRGARRPSLWSGLRWARDALPGLQSRKNGLDGSDHIFYLILFTINPMLYDPHWLWSEDRNYLHVSSIQTSLPEHW